MSDLDNTDWADGLPSTDGMEDMNTAELETFDDPSKSKAPLSREERKKLDAILDIPVTITMEVGHAKISIRNLLQLNQGSVIELERLAGEPLDVLVNGTLSSVSVSPMLSARLSVSRNSSNRWFVSVQSPLRRSTAIGLFA